MGLLKQRLATFLLLALLVTNSAMLLTPVDDTWDQATVVSYLMQPAEVSESLLNLTIPFVDDHYGNADGIIDPTEYAASYTDPNTGITVYLEHNSTVLFVGLEATTSGWIALGWKNSTYDFRTDGLNNSDLIFGYAPGTPHEDYDRVTASDVVTVHYILSLRNGTIIEEGNIPNDESTTPISEESLLQGYKDAIIGMRIGEVKHFIIPANEAYNQPSNPMYGEDLEYVITVSRINNDFLNPSVASDIVYSDEYGISTFQHLPDTNQSRILAADGSDNGAKTQLEYYILMNSTDPHDIPLLDNASISYPFFMMFGNNEDITTLPVQHSEWASPPVATILPNEGPDIIIESPEANATLGYVVDISLNITDSESWVRRAHYRLDDENWIELFYDFKTTLWDVSVDLTGYEEGLHTIWVNATDPSNCTTIESIDINVDRPYLPLLGMKLDVERTFSTKLFHTTEVRDVYTIRNNGSAPINAIEIFLPVEYGSRLLDMSAVDSDGNTLKLTRLENYQELYHWRVYTYQAVDYNQVYEFTITSYYHSLHTISDYSQNFYEVEFLKLPLVPYVLSSGQLILAFRSGDTIISSSPEGSWFNLLPMQRNTFTYEMKSFTPLIVADRQTVITIDPWGYMRYHETISMRNIGPTRENIFLFTLPEYVTAVKIYDEVGVLANSQPGGEWNLNSTVDLQINLQQDRFGENGFFPDYSYTFYMDYTVQVSGHSITNATGEVLTLPMGTFADCLIQTHTVDVVLSPTFSIHSVSGEYRLLYGVFDTTLQYTVHNTTVHNPPRIVLVYSISLGSALRPIAFAMIVALIGSVFVVYRRLSFIEDSSSSYDDRGGLSETRQAGAPVELLSDFAKTYSKKIALNLEMEKLDSDRRRGKVTKKEYMLRDRDIKNQIQEVENALPSLKETLVQYGVKYRDLISQLELQDEKIEGAKAGLRQLLLRKKKQKISRAAFEKSRQDYLKTIKKATTATDRILLTFQEEAGEI
ncbi:MAG: FKBP-type peptidyl-prolyl cis-trans isomerase [Candidatus Thorarchaeota archaeon]